MSPLEEVRYLILAAQREGNRMLAQALAPRGLTPAQAEVLTAIADAGPVSLKALGERLVCEAGSPSRLVSICVERGWVARREDPADRRAVVLTLTPDGRDAVAAVRAVEADLYGWLDARIVGPEVERLAAPLRRLVAGTPAGEAVARRAGR